MSDFKPTWLYLKQHNITGLKYFGKTVKDPNHYLGSGVYWTKHLEKHGTDISTVWRKLFTNKEELTQYALNFSIKNNIVESKEYANLMPEDGLVGGDTGLTEHGRLIISEKSKKQRHSDETKQKIREARKNQKDPRIGKTHTEETKQKIREARKLQIITDESNKKRSIKLKGRKFSEERNMKISSAVKGRKFSEETKKKMSLAAKLRHSKEVV